VEGESGKEVFNQYEGGRRAVTVGRRKKIEGSSQRLGKAERMDSRWCRDRI